jgi:hypothetical protein
VDIILSEWWGEWLRDRTGQSPQQSSRYEDVTALKTGSEEQGTRGASG